MLLHSLHRLWLYSSHCLLFIANPILQAGPARHYTVSKSRTKIKLGGVKINVKILGL